MEQEARQRAAEGVSAAATTYADLCGAAGVFIRGVGPPAFLDLVGQVLPWRSSGHPEALQQLEALLVQRLPRVCVTRVCVTRVCVTRVCLPRVCVTRIPGVSHQRAPCWCLPKS